MSKTTKWMTAASAAAVLVTVVGCGAANNSANNAASNTTAASGSQKVTLAETGSSLLYPLFNGEWISAYKSVDSNVTMTAASTGSGTGQTDAINGTVQIGASDAYLSSGQMQQNPSMLNIPVAISAQQIMYNLPGIPKNTHLKLSAPVLAKIYEGKITKWNDPAIQSLNSGVTLPNLPIIPVVRSDGSGDTFLFTSFLNTASSTFQPSTQESWPTVQSEVSANGNDGVVTVMGQNKGSVGYVGISWLDKAQQQGLGYAALKNKNGNFVLPSSVNIKAAVSNVPSVPADEILSLINEPGTKSYPIINFEYALINSQQKSAATATALKNFLNWAISPTGGNQSKYLAPVHFQPLPSNVKPLSQAQINKIQG